MKKLISIILIAVMSMSMLLMTSCGSEFGCTDNDEKHMTITAKNAGAGDYFMSGTLEVGEDEQIVIDPSLDKGSVTIEFVESEGASNEEELPDTDTEAKYTAYLTGTNSQAASFGAGSFMVKATVTEKATGTIEINVKGFGE